MNLLQKLKTFGLTELEAKVYIALFKITEGSVQQIAREAKVPRPSAYAVLESLKTYGLVNSFSKKTILHYTPENPSQLLSVVKKKEEIAHSIIPELQKLNQQHEFKPTVRLYEGIDGLKTVFEDILETAKKEKIKQVCGITSPAITKTLPKYLPQWIQKRVRLGISTKLIGPKSYPTIYPRATSSKKELREFRYLPDKYTYKYLIYFYSKKIALFSLKENETNSLIVESPALVEMLSALFNFTWDRLGEEK